MFHVIDLNLKMMFVDVFVVSASTVPVEVVLA